MGRSTQYIGLNRYAKSFIKNAIKVESCLVTEGMFGEPVGGNIYHMPPPDGPNKLWILKEVEQDAPWSSGPMIFTCLHSTLVKEDGEKIDCGLLFRWMEDPTVTNEYDYETGRYYV